MLTAAKARRMAKNGIVKRDRSMIITKMIIEMVIRAIETDKSTCITNIFTSDRVCDYNTKSKCVTMLEALGYKYIVVDSEHNIDLLSW